jgi:hypothetical protein
MGVLPILTDWVLYLLVMKYLYPLLETIGLVSLAFILGWIL